MGKGIARDFKARYPQMFREYKMLCDNNSIEIGALHLWQGPTRWVLNFPTKTTWRLPSKLDYVEEGLKTFKSCYRDMGITSVSFPPLGCGNGNLDWLRVRPLMLRYLSNLDIQIFIHEVSVGDRFLPEHKELHAQVPPLTFSEFMLDLRSMLTERGHKFINIVTKTPFESQITEDLNLDIFTNKKQTLLHDELIGAWTELTVGLLSTDTKKDSLSNYLLSIISTLPYVRRLTVVPDVKRPGEKALALFLAEPKESYQDFSVSRNEATQACLFP